MVVLFIIKQINYKIHYDSLINSIYFSNYTKLNDLEQFFVDTAYEYLKITNFDVQKEGYIEFRHFNLSNDEDSAIYFDVVQEDENVNKNVETCIFITQTEKYISGNFDFYRIGYSSPKSPTTNISINKHAIEHNNISFVSSTTVSKKEIIINENAVILISGNIMYCYQPIFGKGIRNIITVKFISNRI